LDTLPPLQIDSIFIRKYKMKNVNWLIVGIISIVVLLLLFGGGMMMGGWGYHGWGIMGSHMMGW
jgi:hypothetical protein